MQCKCLYSGLYQIIWGYTGRTLDPFWSRGNSGRGVEFFKYQVSYKLHQGKKKKQTKRKNSEPP